VDKRGWTLSPALVQAVAGRLNKATPWHVRIRIVAASDRRFDSVPHEHGLEPGAARSERSVSPDPPNGERLAAGD
jgi:hypothetical protein